MRQMRTASHKTGELKGAQLEQIHPEAREITPEGGRVSRPLPLLTSLAIVRPEHAVRLDLMPADLSRDLGFPVLERTQDSDFPRENHNVHFLHHKNFSPRVRHARRRISTCSKGRTGTLFSNLLLSLSASGSSDFLRA